MNQKGGKIITDLIPKESKRRETKKKKTIVMLVRLKRNHWPQNEPTIEGGHQERRAQRH